MNLTEETILLAFKAISNFTNDLCQEYGPRHKPLQLYTRLVSKTQITHEKAIQKHIVIFQRFCFENRNAILQRNKGMISLPKITYSERVYIDMAHIMNLADTDTQSVIWSHLLTISAILDPEGKAKEALLEEKKARVATPTTSGGADFLTNIIEKVGSNIKPGASPMDAISSLLQSGVFGELLSGLQSGQLDIPGMLGSVKGAIAKMDDGNPESKQTVEMLNSLTSMATGANSAGTGSPPDMSGILNMVMSSLNKQTETPSVDPVSSVVAETPPSSEK